MIKSEGHSERYKEQLIKNRIMQLNDYVKKSKMNSISPQKVIKECYSNLQILTEIYGYKTCFKNLYFVQTLLDMNMFRNYLHDKNDIDAFYNQFLIRISPAEDQNKKIAKLNEVFEGLTYTKKRLMQTNSKDKTIGHYLASSRAFLANNFTSVEYGLIENFLVNNYANNKDLARLQDNNGNTVGHLAANAESWSIAKHYVKDIDLNNIQNKNFQTVQDIINNNQTKTTNFASLTK